MQPASDGNGAGRRSSQLRRYGPLAVIVALLVVVGAVVIVGGGGDDGDEAAGGSGNANSLSGWAEVGDEPGAPAPEGRMPVTYEEAEAAGEVDDYEWPDSCDTERGTLAIPSVFAAPCVPAFEGDNGGATSPGVTADEIRVVYYAPEQSADLQSILGGMGANDTAEQRRDTLESYVELFMSLGETYGRDVVLERFAATGAADDVVASRADATDVLAMEPFAVLGGPALDRGTFAQELADAGVLCFGCAGVLPNQMVLDMAPYLWSSLPTPEQFLTHLDAWVTAGVEDGVTSTARFAGGDLEGQEARTGVVNFEQDPPIYNNDDLQSEERMQNVALQESYVLDFPTLPARAAEIIARFKSEGINQIVFLGDPFMPIYLTQAATQQDYYPEWIFTGTALTDTNTFGRQYDQAQMENAYGISQLAAPTEQELQENIRLYRWFYGEDAFPAAANQYALLSPGAAWLAAGIHMAGPELTPETFARGLFRIPPRGGGPANPQVSYGNWGFFPDMDYQGVDDSVEIWWDPDVEVEDERGDTGIGAWRRSGGGERFTAEEAPSPRPFTVEGSVTVLDELTGEDAVPDYPPPPGSPAASAS
jgi:hypothetical protein